MRAGRVLRQAVIGRLRAAVPALGGRVFDHALETTPYPYATLGASYGSDASVQCITARSLTLQVDVWQDRSNKGELEDLVDDVSAALEGWADGAVLAMHPMRVTLMRVMDDPSGALHGVVQVEAMVES